MSDILLNVENLCLELKSKKNTVSILSDVSFSLSRGKCIGILGESGSGKSMTVKSIMGLLDKNFLISGSARFEGMQLINQSKENLRKLRGTKISMVLQNPMVSFDPLYKIGEQIEETFKAHTNFDDTTIRQKSVKLLKDMMIKDEEEVLRKYPHSLSGGMLQRIMIGLSLCLEPELIIADEPTTALDSITQFEILRLLKDIKENKNKSMIFISHDLSAISYIADYILVMNRGKVVDRGSFKDIIKNSNDPYTRFLIEKKIKVMKKYKEAMKKT